MEQELDSIFGELPSPGGKRALANWRCLARTSASGNIDWDKLPSECDPMRGGGLGPDAERGSQHRRERPKEEKESLASAAVARAERKRVQVESFYMLLEQMLPRPSLADEEHEAPEACSASTSVPTTVVDFGCGSGNLTLPLAALMPLSLIHI